MKRVLLTIFMTAVLSAPAVCIPRAAYAAGEFETRQSQSVNIPAEKQRKFTVGVYVVGAGCIAAAVLHLLLHGLNAAARNEDIHQKRRSDGF